MQVNGDTRTLQRLFKRNKIVKLEDLFVALKTTSRMTVFRRMSAIGYFASCSHAGRFYTLKTIPEYDPHGLWRYTEVLFSRFGTLKETVRNLVEASNIGQYHRELESRLQLRVHNTLADLVAGKLLRREQIAGDYLYLSGELARAKIQLANRSREAKVTKEYPLVVVIEVLLEVIHSAKVHANANSIAHRLQNRGVIVATKDVDDILEQHGVVKKKV
jgi:hypothetical protein